MNAYVFRLPDFVRVDLESHDYPTCYAVSEEVARSKTADKYGIDDPADIALLATIEVDGSGVNPKLLEACELMRGWLDGAGGYSEAIEERGIDTLIAATKSATRLCRVAQLEGKYLTHFVRLAKRGKDAGASGGEYRCRSLAVAIVENASGLDSEAIAGAQEFVKIAAAANVSARAAVGL